MKQCKKCLIVKPYSNFHKKKAVSDGYAYHCKECVRDYDLKENDSKRVMPRKIQGTQIHCRRCDQYLNSDMFGKTKTYCKECTSTIGHIGNLKRFGLNVISYSNLEKSQNGVCAICKLPETNKRRLSVDHDHSCCDGSFSCGKCIRGLLCSNCNTFLGNAKDSIKILQSAIEYLKK
jgi:hypothetical protein